MKMVRMVRIKNKKAQAGELIQDTVGLIAIVLLLVIFFVISTVILKSYSKELNTIATSQALHNQEHTSLQALLQKTVDVDIDGATQKMTIADLSRLSKINPEYETLLKQKVAEAYSEIYNYNFSLITTKEAQFKIRYEFIQVGGTFILVPIITDVKGQQFFIPSNETIVAHLEVKGIKND
ncbi:MAG: hypothetical protein K6T16_00510 [Candidatus Pacearchaeota archaeon]|nr:hypothetical protein [Candidatus Pacearchaeota archaeon]